MIYIITAIVLFTFIYLYKKKNYSFSKNYNDVKFTFSVSNLNKDEVENLKENSSVNLWQKPNSSTIFVYRSGTMGGRGRIGVVPKEYSKQIISDLKNDRTYQAKIVNLSLSNVSIQYFRPSPKKVEKAQRNYLNKQSQKLQQLLNKDYNPQKGFSISVNFDKAKDYEVGDPVNIKFREKEHYIKNPQSLELDFCNQNGQKIANKSNHPDKIRRILRAHFNDYKINANISSIRDLDEYEIKYYDHIPGAVRIDFEKNT